MITQVNRVDSRKSQVGTNGFAAPQTRMYPF